MERLCCTDSTEPIEPVFPAPPISSQECTVPSADLPTSVGDAKLY